MKLRWWACALAGLIGASVVHGQEKRPTQVVPTRIAGQEEPLPKLVERKPGDIVVLQLTPRGEPTPAFRYQLLPLVGELHHGNAAHGYLRAMTPSTLANLMQERSQHRIAWLLTAPLAEVKKEDWIRDSRIFKQYDAAARMTYADWNLESIIREQHIHTLIPEAQDVRFAARVMALRVRYYVAQGDWPQAFEVLKTGFTMCRHVQTIPTLITSLVASAMMNDLMDQLETVIQQPGAPNLYWALTDLPDPFIDFRTAWQGERWFVELILKRPLDEQNPAATRVMTPQEIEAVLATFRELAQHGKGKNPGQDEQRPDLTAHIASSAGAARETLRQFGVPEATLKAMSDTQAALGAAQLHYRVTFDRLKKLAHLPAETVMAERQKILNEVGPGKDSADFPKLFTALFLPAVERCVTVELRVRQRVAALRVVESLRLHAAQTGKWPEKLSDVTLVPMPHDPFTGQPFAYTFSGNAATLQTTVKGQPMWVNYRLELGK